MAYAILYLPDAMFVSDWPHCNQPAIFDSRVEAQTFIVDTLMTANFHIPAFMEKLEIVEVEDV